MAKLNIFNVVLALLIVVAPMVLAEVELSPSAEPGLYSYVEQCVAVTGAIEMGGGDSIWLLYGKARYS